MSERPYTHPGQGASVLPGILIILRDWVPKGPHELWQSHWQMATEGHCGDGGWGQHWVPRDPWPYGIGTSRS